MSAQRRTSARGSPALPLMSSDVRFELEQRWDGVRIWSVWREMRGLMRFDPPFPDVWSARVWLNQNFGYDDRKEAPT
jgi:hypothetical protein